MLVLVCLLRVYGGVERLCFVGILLGHGRRDQYFRFPPTEFGCDGDFQRDMGISSC